MTTRSSARQCGIGVPLFSLASTTSWGIGEFRDLPAFASWCRAAGQAYVQLLPLNEMTPGETSPYSSMTTMALDPIYIALDDVSDFAALGGVEGLDDADRPLLASVRSASSVRYADVRDLKTRALRRAFARFSDETRRGGEVARAQAFAEYRRHEAWWLDEYTTFRAIHAAQDERAWWQWPAPLAQADRDAVLEASAALEAARDYYAYLQWIADGQWQAARRAAGIHVFGDLPFMISGDSPDVWARRGEFILDASVGVPPDAFSETGQDWGLPPWRWDVMQRAGFRWMRGRARRTAALFDGVRIDHLVGLYRIYVRPLDKSQPKVFSPPDEPTQSRLGAQLLGIYLQAGIEVVAEDLGTVPDFVRWSLARVGVPGFKVMRWERAWKEPGQPFIDPARYPEVSVALSGTHDTESLAQWWRELSAADREVFLAMPSLAGVRPGSPFVPDVRDALLRALVRGTSRYIMLPLQDVFGWDVRINTPATVSDRNWTWKLPLPVDRWQESPEWVERADTLAAWLAV